MGFNVMTPELMRACAYYGMGQMLAFFQVFSQHIWPWWEGRPVLATMLFGVPAGFFFWFATREAVLAMGEAWGPRMLGFGMSYITFPVLAWYFMNETPFSPKTLLCIILSFCIISIQLFWKTS
jgi:hypothetical protein